MLGGVSVRAWRTDCTACTPQPKGCPKGGTRRKVVVAFLSIGLAANGVDEPSSGEKHTPSEGDARCSPQYHALAAGADARHRLRWRAARRRRPCYLTRSRHDSGTGGRAGWHLCFETFPDEQR